MQKNKRKYHRIPSADFPCTVLIDGVKLVGQLRDESIAGAKIAGLDLLMLPLHKQVEIEMEEEKIIGFARNAIREEDGTIVVGFQRAETSQQSEGEDSAILVNSFITHHGSFAICVPLGLEPDNMVKVQLWNGKQFVVPYPSLQSMTRLERFEQLADPAHLEFAAGIYGLGAGCGRTKVFEFEYGKMVSCPTKGGVML